MNVVVIGLRRGEIKSLILFFSGMVGPFLDLTLVAEEELRRTTLPLFYDLLECEYANKGSFKQVEQALIIPFLLHRSNRSHHSKNHR